MAAGVNIAGDAPLTKRAGAATISLTDVVSGGVDELYYGSLGVGTPAQSITFDFDTCVNPLQMKLMKAAPPIFGLLLRAPMAITMAHNSTRQRRPVWIVDCDQPILWSSHPRFRFVR
jgi:hypothetical protein